MTYILVDRRHISNAFLIFASEKWYHTMKHLFSVLVYVLLLGGRLSLSAQHMYSKQFPFLEQLPSNEIQDIHQDREGFLWIATTNGLARYDGYRLLNFRSDYKNPNLLASNSLTNIDDNGQFVWIASWGGINLYDKHTCHFTPFPDEKLKNQPVSYVAFDKNGNAWIASNGKIFLSDSTAHVKAEYNLTSPTGNNQGGIQSIYIDNDNKIWVITRYGLFGYNAQESVFEHYPCNPLGTSAYVMFQDKSGNYWLGTWDLGLWAFYPDRNGEDRFERCHTIDFCKDLTSSTIYDIEQDDTFGYLWVLSHGGLYVLKQTDSISIEMVDIHNLVDTHMMYTRICKDREGNLWLGSYDTGYTILFNNPNVDNYPLLQLKKELGWDANILNLAIDQNDIIWFEQDRHGLCLYDLSRDLYVDSGIGEVNVIQKSRHKPGVWVNSRYKPYIMRLTQKSLNVRIEESIFIKEGGVRDLVEDKDGNLWISVYYGNLQIKCPNSQSLVLSNEKTPPILLLTKDTNGQVWGMSNENHFYLLKCDGQCISNEWKGSAPPLAEKESTNSFCIDKDGCIWLSTSLGRILKSDKELKEFDTVPLDEKIQNCTILGVLSDNQNVWIITNKNVIKYSINSNSTHNYSTTEDNVSVKLFRNKAACSDNQGGLYVGGHQGFIHIHETAEAPKMDFVPHLHITDIRLDDKSIFLENIQKEDNDLSVTLTPNNKKIEISFSPLLYSITSKYKVAYRLDGVDNDWVWLGRGISSVYYNHLTKGSYELHLKLESEWDEMPHDEITLHIIKEPAFYETWIAYLFYILLIGASVYLATRAYVHRMKLKSDTKLEEELTRMKLTYFTNISHELLTPLTVISCITDYLEQKVPTCHQQSIMLKANVDKLKRLIQQVLDFRKMDTGKLKLNVTQGQIQEYILNICNVNFAPLARKKNISLNIEAPEKEISGYADFDKLDKILHNLLSNAIKYTPANRLIRINIKSIKEDAIRKLVIEIADEGIGIPSSEIEHIFSRFYSSPTNRNVESNGIGLSLTKELVTMHHGEISVKSELEHGSCFTVKLPIDKESYTADELFIEPITIESTVDENGESEDNVLNNGDQFTLLIIDDNTELLTVMKRLFRKRYQVLTATDGKETYEILNNQKVDIIICDVMLPDINGWELCSHIKEDLRFSHIPVIILTAKNGVDDRIASYEAGADGYIAKPFESKILLARINNLIKASITRQRLFRKEENPNLDNLAYPQADKRFLQSVIDNIKQHLEDETYGLEQLAVEVHMSKSTLYRKIKSMTGMAPLDFVRNIKMKQACIMLIEGRRNISEIAYSVGFTSPKYFSKCFKEEFGVSPSDYNKSRQDKPSTPEQD